MAKATLAKVGERVRRHFVENSITHTSHWAKNRSGKFHRSLPAPGGEETPMYQVVSATEVAENPRLPTVTMTWVYAGVAPSAEKEYRASEMRPT